TATHSATTSAITSAALNTTTTTTTTTASIALTATAIDSATTSALTSAAVIDIGGSSVTILTATATDSATTSAISSAALNDIGGSSVTTLTATSTDSANTSATTPAAGHETGVTIPHPSAWFPLNCTYDTSEIENRTTSGSRKGKVYLSLGPDGKRNGSYFFGGSETAITSSQDVPAPKSGQKPNKNIKSMRSQCSSIFFSNDSLDLGVPNTILFWLYSYDSDAIFLQYGNTKFSVYDKTIQVKIENLRLLLTGILAEKGWTFVGLSYNKTSAEAQLWFDGNMVNSTRILPKFYSQRSQSMTLGGKGFQRKNKQLMLFNLTLTKEQIQGIKGRIKLPVMILNSTIILNNSFYRAELASFLAPAVGQMESKWKLCYHAPANGWKTEIFHRNCDNKTHTVTIIKKESFIFGGYTDIPWESTSGSTWGETLKAFIFSLNNSGFPPFKCFAKNTGNL
ncbi:PREDICTED: uncharacterized protein LOC107329746, partial [Acropora digitifera]|uniref:uncharacterized protein LOC107329746 n=1 Tax=Acropora digitifera TaxID=70779 RepID=UPI00077A1666